MEDQKKYTFMKNIDKIAKRPEYINPKVTPEGYGSIMRNCDTKPQTSLKNTTTRKNINFKIKTLLNTLKDLKGMDKADAKKFCLALKSPIKLIDEILGLASVESICDIEAVMKWAAFNLIFTKITHESFLLTNNSSIENMSYLIGELKKLYRIFNTSTEKPFCLVDINTLEIEIKSKVKIDEDE